MVKDIEELYKSSIEYFSIVTDVENIENILDSQFLKNMRYKKYSLKDRKKASLGFQNVIYLCRCSELKEYLEDNIHYMFIPLDADFFKIVDIKRPQSIYLLSDQYNKNEILTICLYASLESKDISYLEDINRALEYLLDNKLMYINVITKSPFNTFYILLMLIRMLYVASKNLPLNRIINSFDDSIKTLTKRFELNYCETLITIDAYNIHLAAYQFKNNYNKDSYDLINEKIPFIIKKYKENLDNFGYDENIYINEMYIYLKNAWILSSVHSDYFQLSLISLV